MVRKFLIERSMTTHHFDGCMLGVLGNNGQPMKKSWTIAGNFKELAVLDSLKCDGKHEHDQSRGKALKLAENYTFKLTNMLHECFRVAVVGQTSKRISPAVIRACPAKMADSRYATAHPASREAALEATREANKHAWVHLHNRILYALAMRNEGEGQASQDLVDGLMTEWTPASALRFYGREDPLAEYLSFCFMPKESHLEKIMLPEMPINQVIWILVSDSSCALITGRRKTLKKYDLSEHFQQRKPKYVTEFIHEMLWGKTLQKLVKRGIELAADARERYPEARINLHLSWFGNELVGEEGIAQNPNWPYDGPNGHWPTILDDCERHLTWFVNKARELDLQSAGLTTAPWSADYGIHPIFDQFFDALEPKFKALTCSPLGLANPNFPWLRAKGYADAMEFRDQWHFANSEENRTRLSAYWTATLFAIDCGWRAGWPNRAWACTMCPGIMGWPAKEHGRRPRRAAALLSGDDRRHHQVAFWRVPKTHYPNGQVIHQGRRRSSTAWHRGLHRRQDVGSWNLCRAPSGWPSKTGRRRRRARNFRHSIDHSPNSRGLVEVTPKSSACLCIRSRACRRHRSHFQPVPAAGNCALRGTCIRSRESILDGGAFAWIPIYNGDQCRWGRCTRYPLWRYGIRIGTAIGIRRGDHRQPDSRRQEVFWFCGPCQQSLQGDGSCAKVPMDKDLWIDLEDFAKAFRKEVPPDVFITVSNLFGTAMKIDKHGKSRFQFLCAKMSHFPVDNGLGMPYYPVKIRAIQGHSEAALKTAGGLYANSTMVYCSDQVSPERKAASQACPFVPWLRSLMLHSIARWEAAGRASHRTAWSQAAVTQSTAAVPTPTCRSTAWAQMGTDLDWEQSVQ